jgi:hypothetical protein
MYHWLYYKGKRKGESLELYIRPLSEIPIKRASSVKQQSIIDLVDRILAAKQRGADADVSAFEHKIDQLVYALYGLTPRRNPNRGGRDQVKLPNGVVPPPRCRPFKTCLSSKLGALGGRRASCGVGIRPSTIMRLARLFHLAFLLLQPSVTLYWIDVFRPKPSVTATHSWGGVRVLVLFR